MNVLNPILLGVGGGILVLLLMAVIKIGITAWVYSSFNKGRTMDFDQALDRATGEIIDAENNERNTHG